jgi:carboxymethylenebutenolidase
VKNDPEANELEILYHLYQDGALTRRELVSRAARHTGGVAAALAALQALGLAGQPAAAQCVDEARVPEGAPDLETQLVEFPGPGGLVFAYLARPRDGASPPRSRTAGAPAGMRAPGVLVIHENQGLSDHIKDVTRRVARAGFVALGVDLLSRVGGSQQFSDPRQATTAYNRIGAAAFLEDMLAGLAYLKESPFVQGGKLGAVGFCAGGGNCLNLAVSSADVSAAVSFYPTAVPAAEQVDRLNAPLLGIFAELDRLATTRVSGLLAALLDRQKTFGLHIYEGARHAFHNDTGPAYNRSAACDAWSKTIDFFSRHLRG